MTHAIDELVTLQRAADDGRSEVLRLQDSYGRPSRGEGWSEEQTVTYEAAWRAWREAAIAVQAAVTEHAREGAALRDGVEAEVKLAARHPEFAAQ
ncbi:hypothetical protein ACIPEL_36230 [Streptomyces griseoviridis]